MVYFIPYLNSSHQSCLFLVTILEPISVFFFLKHSTRLICLITLPTVEEKFFEVNNSPNDCLQNFRFF